MSELLDSQDKLGPAEQLVGCILLREWKVIERIRVDDGLTGATRSACYRAENDRGQLAFVKAYNFRREDLMGDTDQLEIMVREYNHERNVHLWCRENKLSRITRIIGADKVVIQDEAVHFLVCEWAEKCLREEQPPGDSTIPLSLRFSALRDVAASIAQLHGSGIAHQDIKPSNAMCFQGRQIKLTDLGSTSCPHISTPPHDLEVMVGQPNYAPYELIYDEPSTNWRTRRLGCDMFLLGNMCFTLIVGASLSVFALHALPAHLRPDSYTGPYSEVVPYLIEAHEQLVSPFMDCKLPPDLVVEVASLVSALMHPDPSRRGHARNIAFGGNQFGMERFVSRFDALSRKAALQQ